jgi:hypothetical protein
MQAGVMQLPTIARNDWIIRFFRIMKLKPLGVFFFVMLFNLLVDLILVIGFNAWNSTNQLLGFGKEPGAWAIDFIAQPLLVATYVWINNVSGTLIVNLIEKGRVKLNPESSQQIQSFSRQINSRWFSFICILLGGIIQLLISYFLIIDPANPDWVKFNNTIIFVRAGIGFFVFITGMLLLFLLVIFLYRFNRIISLSEIIIEPFHPDNAGGMGEIGHTLANFGYVILCFGFALILLFYQSQLNTNYFSLQAGGQAWMRGGVVYLLVYMLLAPSAFFLPALTTHQAMQKHKQNMLIDISKNIDTTLKNVHSIKLETPSKVKPSIEKLKQLEYLREITMKYPTWPYNQGNLRKYLGLVFTPLISIALSILSNGIYDILVIQRTGS